MTNSTWESQLFQKNSKDKKTLTLTLNGKGSTIKKKVFVKKRTFDTIDCTDSIKPSWPTLTLAQREGKRNENRFAEKDFFLPFLCISLLLLPLFNSHKKYLATKLLSFCITNPLDKKKSFVLDKNMSKKPCLQYSAGSFTVTILH